MSASGRLVRGLLLALAGFLLSAWLVPREVYAPWFRAGANSMFRSVPTDLTAKLTPLNDRDGLTDTRLNVGRRSSRLGGGINLDSKREGYLPAALVACLILATPVPWRRRWKALLAGLLAIHAFVALRLCVTAASGFTAVSVDGQRLLPLSPFWTEVLALMDALLSADLHITYVAPVLIWLVVTVRPGDLAAFRAIGGGSAPRTAQQPAPAGPGIPLRVWGSPQGPTRPQKRP